MKKSILSLFVAMVLFVSVSCTSFGSGPEKTIKRFEKSFNEYDIDNMISCFEPSVQRVYYAAMDVIGALAGDIDVNSLLSLGGSIAYLFEDYVVEGGMPKLEIDINSYEISSDDEVVFDTTFVYIYGKGIRDQLGDNLPEEQKVYLTMKFVEDDWYISNAVMGQANNTSGNNQDQQEPQKPQESYDDDEYAYESEFAVTTSSDDVPDLDSWDVDEWANENFNNNGNADNQPAETTAVVPDDFTETQPASETKASENSEPAAAESESKPAPSVTEAEVKTNEKNQSLHTATDGLNGDLKELYDTFCSQLDQYNTVVYAGKTVGDDMIASVVNLLTEFNPEYFWINNGYSTKTKKSETVVSFNAQKSKAKDIKKMNDELEQKISAITSGASNGSDDFAKAVFVHDYIVSKTSYSKNAADNNAYGCLAGGKTGSRGYAEAFALVMKKLGMNAGVVSVGSDNGSAAWNYIYMNKKYYWIDVYKDDIKETSGFDAVSHAYFGFNDNMLHRSADSQIKSTFVPECVSTGDNYFVRNKAYFDKYTVDSIDNVLSSSLDKGFAEFMISDKNAFTTAYKKLFDAEEIWNTKASKEFSGNINYEKNEDMYVISVDF